MVKSKRRIETSSDASLRLDVAKAWASQYPADAELLVLAGTSIAANAFHLGRLNSHEASFGTRRFTIAALVSQLARRRLAEAGRATASALSFTAVIARVIHLLKTESRIDYFLPVATKPGFPRALARTLNELRMNDIEPEALSYLGATGKDLAVITRAVDDELDSRKLADRAVVYQEAIASLKVGEIEGAAGLPLLFLDLPIHSVLEVRLIRELARHSPDVLAVLPLGDNRTASSLEDILDCQQSVIRAQGPTTSLSLAKEHLFQDTSPELSTLDESMILSSWPGESRECVEIVRSIQQEAENNVPFDHMAVFLNASSTYRPHLEEAFGRAEIPVFFAEGATSLDPSGRAMMALLSCVAEGISASRFAEYLSLGQVPIPGKADTSAWAPPRDELLTSDQDNRQVEAAIAERQPHLDTPDQPGSEKDILHAPWRWESLLVDAAVIGGKQRWQRRLTGLENELRLRLSVIDGEEQSRAAAIHRQLRDLAQLKSSVLPLVELMASFPETATWGEWLAKLRQLAIRALRYPKGVLSTLSELEAMEPVGPVDLQEVQLVLGPSLRELVIPPGSRRHGAVFVGPVTAARGLSFDIVFIPGLAERVFPGKIVEDSILSDSYRSQLSRSLPTRHERLEEERLGLRLAVGAATRRVYLSYPRVDNQQARRRVASFYALEVLRAAEGSLLGFEELAARAEGPGHARLGWPAPAHPELAIDEAEYDLALLGDLVSANQEDQLGSINYLLTVNPHLARALRARSRKWLRRWTINDGLVDPDEPGLEALSQHQYSHRSFSATALQLYASCPYKFFLSALLHLEPRESLAAIDVIDPLTRGALFHEMQFAVLTRLKAEGLLPPRRETLPSIFVAVNGTVSRIASFHEDRLAPAIPRVWQDSINSIRVDLQEWLRRLAESDDGSVPERFELTFGLGTAHTDADRESAAPILIGDLQLQGSIDLVDRLGNGQLRITDHKTGKVLAKKDLVVGGGQYLQPLLYSLACQALLQTEVVTGRLYYCTANGGYEERCVSVNDTNIESLRTVITTIGDALSEGFLPAAPEKDACGWCDFRVVCGGLEEKRTARKPSDRLMQLNRIRGLA